MTKRSDFLEKYGMDPAELDEVISEQVDSVLISETKSIREMAKLKDVTNIITCIDNKVSDGVILQEDIEDVKELVSKLLNK